MAVDRAGNIYFPSDRRIDKMDTSGIITTVAGNGTDGYSGDGGPATQAQLNYPDGVEVDAADNLYIVDSHNHRIRKVDAGGAGNGTDGYSGDGGPATQAQLNYPDGVVVDTAGNLYIADRYNYRVRKVDADGIITTIAGDGTQSYNCYGHGNSATRISLVAPLHLQIDALGNLYIDSGCCLLKVDKSGMTSVILEDECFPPVEGMFSARRRYGRG